MSADEDLRYVSVNCRTCATRVMTELRDEEHEVQCPDCLLPVVVPARATIAERKLTERRRRERAEHHAKPYRLAETQDAPEEDAPDSAGGSSEQLICAGCRRVLRPHASDLPRRLRCRKCGQQNYVPPHYGNRGDPRSKKRPAESDSVVAQPGLMSASGHLDIPGPGSGPVSPGQFLERLAEIRQETVDPPPDRPFISGVFNFAWAPAIRIRTLILSFGLFLILMLLGTMLLYAEQVSGYASVGLAFFALPLVWIFIWVLSYASAMGLVILEDTANGMHQPVNWPDPDWREWAEKAIFQGWIGTLSLTIGYVLSYLMDNWEPRWTGVGFVVAASMSFPFLLLSALESNRIIVPFSLRILSSLTRSPLVWIGYYFLSGILFGAGTGLYLALNSVAGPVAAAFSAPILAAVWVVWMRLTGRLGWILLRAIESRESQRSRQVRTVATLILAALAGSAPCSTDELQAQPTAVMGTFQPEDIDRTLNARFRLAEDFISDSQWPAAIDLLDAIQKEQGERLSEVGPGLFWSANRRVQDLVFRAGSDFIERYQQRTEVRARRLFEAGSPTRVGPWLEILNRFFLSRPAAGVLEQLGMSAWRRGRPDEAHRYWMRLLSAAGADGETTWRHTGAKTPAAEIEARLILCDLAAGKIPRARRRFTDFSARYSDIRGTIAGREGPLVSLLSDELEGTGFWTMGSSADPARSFVRSDQRIMNSMRIPRPGPILWSLEIPLSPRWFTGSPDRTGPLPWIFPLVHRQRLFLATPDRVLGLELRTGQPAWLDSQDFIEPSDRQRLLNATLFPGTVLDPAVPQAERPVRGQPITCLTRSGERLLARYGVPITSKADGELAEWDNGLVCLDLGTGQGRLEWQFESAQLNDDWTIDGTPIVLRQNVYCVVRSSAQQDRLGIACIELERGRLEWLRPVCIRPGPAGSALNRISHHLLVATETSIYLVCSDGTVVAVDPFAGRIQWARQTRMTTQRSNLEASRDQLLHGLLDSNHLLLSPNGSGEVYCLDCHSGAIVWKQYVESADLRILGAHADRVIVSGTGLWGLDRLTGRVCWGQTFPAASSSFGSGMIVGDTVWWSRRDRIEFRSVHDGVPVEQPLLLFPRGGQGGNLTLAPPYLIISEPRRVTVYSPTAGTTPADHQSGRPVR